MMFSTTQLGQGPETNYRWHLSKLATANGAVLATFDENIPGSYLIPN